MNARVLISAIVQQVTVLIAQLATTGGARAPLAQVAGQVFLELARELESQGISKPISADMFGLFENFKPKFAKRYVDLGAQILTIFETYRDEVLAGKFPAEEHTYHIDPKELAKLEAPRNRE